VDWVVGMIHVCTECDWHSQELDFYWGIRGCWLYQWLGLDMIHVCTDSDWCCARKRAFETGTPAIEDIQRRLEKGDGGIEASSRLQDCRWNDRK
jgi:hypothetical protein